jgi:hypothetical protein
MTWCKDHDSTIVYLLFCFSKKVTKKEPEKNYPLFSVGSLIRLLYYCNAGLLFAEYPGRQFRTDNLGCSDQTKTKQH